jgi:UDP-glucuronate 4-epimerase
MNYLVTGHAGFIGHAVTKKLLKKNNKVVGIDNFNNYYDTKLKDSRINDIKIFAKKKKLFFKSYQINIAEIAKVKKIFQKHKINIVIHLAAQAGVRYSLTNPRVYAESNLIGFFNIMQSCKDFRIKKLIYASSSSVYGDSKLTPFKEKNLNYDPIQFYAATKLSNEIMARSYHNLFNLNSLGLRFFTVYGPWGRPDMAIFKFSKKIFNNKEIDVFNYGKHKRDFTFIDDVAKIIVKISASKNLRLFNGRAINLGNSKSVKLTQIIKILSKLIGKKAKIKFKKKQLGDIKDTLSDTSLLKKYFNIKPKINMETGLKRFIIWYKKYYNVKS